MAKAQQRVTDGDSTAHLSSQIRRKVSPTAFMSGTKREPRIEHTINNKRIARAMTKSQEPRPEKEPISDGDSNLKAVSLLALWFNIFVGIALAMSFAFIIVRFTMSRELNQLESVIKDRKQAYFQHLTVHLSEVYLEIRRKESPTAFMSGTNREPRIDHAQFNLGAKVIQFSGEEMVNPNSYVDRLKQTMGLYVPKGSGCVLGKRLNKNKFLTFKGDRAKLLIELNQAIFLDTFKIDHYISNMTDTDSIGMMPKNVIVSGIRNRAIILGELMVPPDTDSNMHTGLLQMDKPRESFKRFQVEVLNNHGHRDMTRLYKIGIFGEIDEAKIVR